MVFPDGEHCNNFRMTVILLKVLKKRFYQKHRFISGHWIGGKNHGH